jgi:hypothetical protein
VIPEPGTNFWLLSSHFALDQVRPFVNTGCVR